LRQESQRDSTVSWNSYLSLPSTKRQERKTEGQKQKGPLISQRLFACLDFAFLTNRIYLPQDGKRLSDTIYQNPFAALPAEAGSGQ
jgi:hypothetical protein